MRRNVNLSLLKCDVIDRNVKYLKIMYIFYYNVNSSYVFLLTISHLKYTRDITCYINALLEIPLKKYLLSKFQ